MEVTMKKYLAVYLGSQAAMEKLGWNALDPATRKQREEAGIDAWMKWGQIRSKSIVDQGTPIGKTKRVDPRGITDTKNAITGYCVVEADSHEAAAKLFEKHPHFTMFPGESIEVMECLDLEEILANRRQ